MLAYGINFIKKACILHLFNNNTYAYRPIVPWFETKYSTKIKTTNQAVDIFAVGVLGLVVSGLFRSGLLEASFCARPRYTTQGPITAYGSIVPWPES